MAHHPLLVTTKIILTVLAVITATLWSWVIITENGPKPNEKHYLNKKLIFFLFVIGLAVLLFLINASIPASVKRMHKVLPKCAKFNLLWWLLTGTIFGFLLALILWILYKFVFVSKKY